MHDELAGLIREHPLPAGFAEPQLYGDSVAIAGSDVRRAGIACATASGAELTGSAADIDGSPVARAYFELLERAAIVEAHEAARARTLRDERGAAVGTLVADAAAPSERARPARSSGVALHRTWEEACRRAEHELVERDRVLRSWYGELPTASARAPELLAPFTTHEWRACSIAEEPDGRSPIEVAAVVGFPRSPELPLARGFAGAASLDDALLAAAREALQGLAFLWDEPVPTSLPRPSPSPMFHLDYYLFPPNHAHLARWLGGQHRGEHRRHRPRAAAPEETRFVDLTPAWFRGALRVARAIRGDARALVFGDLPCLPPGRPGSHIHPIA